MTQAPLKSELIEKARINVLRKHVKKSQRDSINLQKAHKLNLYLAISCLFLLISLILQNFKA